MKKNMKKSQGFTLAELLIVVAIIAVLVAISIPVFTSQLEKAKESTDLANVRSAYAQLLTACMAEDEDIADNSTSQITYSAPTGNKGDYVYTATVQLEQGGAGWKTDDAATAVAGISATGSPTANGTCVITVTEGSNAVTIEYK